MFLSSISKIRFLDLYTPPPNLLLIFDTVLIDIYFLIWPQNKLKNKSGSGQFMETNTICYYTCNKYTAWLFIERLISLFLTFLWAFSLAGAANTSFVLEIFLKVPRPLIDKKKCTNICLQKLDLCLPQKHSD